MPVVAGCRMIKEPLEIDLMRLASQATLRVYEAVYHALKPGMTGYARVDTGRRPVGAILADRLMRYLRTEFWWCPGPRPG